MSVEKPRIPLNDCACCDGQTATTPARIQNRHGLTSVAYRVGDYHSFKDSMLARLSSSDLPALQRLTTRDQDDYSIALIDAWAGVSDVLCFYQEYFANEGLLKTAKERLSILEHARLIGYQLNAGVAASTYLAFTMDEPLTGADNPVLETTIELGSQVQSTPGPGETAQLFETLSDITARVDWNAMRPRMTQPQIVNSSMQSVLLDGITTFVKPGDELLLVDQSNSKFVKNVAAVIVDEDAKTTQLTISGDGFSPDSYSVTPQKPIGTFDYFDGRTVVDTIVIEIFLSLSWAVEDIVAIADTKHWDLDEIAQRINTNSYVAESVGNGKGVYGFHKRANLFGFNAAKKVTYETDYPYHPEDISKWGEWAEKEDSDTLYLDNEYSEITPDSYCILRNNGDLIFQIESVNTVTRSEYGISSKSSKLGLASGDEWFTGSQNPMKDVIRKAVLLAQSEALPLIQVPIDEVISGDRILLDRADFYLRNQQYVSVSGERTDQQGVTCSEVLQIKEVRLERGFTQLIFTTDLKYEYVRSTVAINANIAPASHGESVSEVLGSGDASIPSQSFMLTQTPVTYTSAAVPSGSLSSLEVRVNDVLWHEVDTFLERQAEEKIYTTKLDDNGITHIYFGDGVEGARLPSGTNNIIAYFRKGIGLGGLVKEKQLNLLLTRPLGVKDVLNPTASEGADDPEALADARENAPLGLLTLDRAVSLSDYEDYSRAFAGISKARAVAVSNKGVQSIYISIAGPDGAILDTVGDTYNNLLSALKNSGDPYTNFSLLSYRPAYFKFDAGLYVHSDYQSDLVLEAARQAMREAFSFDARAFNQPVHLSQVIQTLQQVEGVIAVDVNHLYRSDSSPVSPPPRSIMPTVSSSDSEILGAELITLDPAPLDQLRVKA